MVIPFSSLLPIHFCASPKPGTGFPSTYVVVFFFNHLKRDVVVCFVVISGFHFHHCLIFLSINNNFIVFGLCQQGIKLMITLTLYTPLSQFLYAVVIL